MITNKEYCPACGQPKKRDTRSIKQKRLYHMWVDEISDFTGYESDEIHSFFKSEILPSITEAEQVKIVFNRLISVDNTTTKLNTKQFAVYLDRIERYAGLEIGLELSQPEDAYYAAVGRSKVVSG